MALAHKTYHHHPSAEERRRFQRVKVHLLGRYMLPDRREYPCQVINMSPGGVAFLAPGIGSVGATPRKRDKLAAQLTWLANRDILNLPEDRRHERIVPRNPVGPVSFEDGRQINCRIIDVSLSGAAIASDLRPLMRSQVVLGRVQGRVVRHLEDGFAIEFLHEQAPDTLEDSITAR